MKNRITFIIFKNSYANARQISVSKYMLLLLGFLVTMALVTYTHLLMQYYQLKKVAAHNQSLKTTVDHQFHKITAQQHQIQVFAQDINTLKSKLAEIKNFENKIRIIANMDTGDQENGFFGVGGTLPGDIDHHLSSEDTYNGLVREIHAQVEELSSVSLKQMDDFKDLLKQLKKRRNMLASTPAIRPTTGWITSTFGYRKSPFTGRREFHKGLDIATRKGTPVIATADGLVTFSGRRGLLGNLIVIDHGFGLVTRYGHLSKSLIKKGGRVKRGDKIGEVGNTGRSTGPHLHYEVHLNGIKVDPAKYILN